MKHTFPLVWMSLTGVLGQTTLGGEVPTKPAANPRPPWRVGVGYRAVYNLDVSFQQRNAPPALPVPPPGMAYRDGFVGVDSTGNALDLTTYWGYQRESQWAGDSILFNDLIGDSLGSDDSLWAHGLELSAIREMGDFGKSGFWGFESAFSFASLSAETSGSLSLHAFALAGVIPPSAPYTGPQTAGPGVPLLDSSPVTVPLRVRSSLDADLYEFRAGPYLEFPFANAFSCLLGMGVAVDVVDSEVTFQESAPPPFQQLNRARQNNHTGAVIGGYAKGQLNYQFTENWNAFSSAQLNVMQDFEHDFRDRRAKLDLGSAFSLVLGVNYGF